MRRIVWVVALGALCACHAKRAPRARRAPASAPAPSASAHADAGPSLAARRAAVERRLAPLVAKLDEGKPEVDGAAVGIGGSPGFFFLLTRAFIKQARPRDFEVLATDPRPSVRAMGLYGIAQEPRARAAHELLPHVVDPDLVLYLPGGCMGYETPLGLFAHDLLADSHVLGEEGSYPAGSPPPPAMRPRPLLTQRQMFAVDLEILANDRIAGMSSPAPQDLADAVAEGKLAFDLKELVALARFRHLATWQVVKAVGRIEPLKGPRPAAQLRFLVDALASDQLDRETRLAAASALTRFTSDGALAAIVAESAFLDRATGAPLAARFENTIRRRREHEQLMAPIDRAKYDFQLSPLWRRLMRADSETHPLALDDLTSPPNFSGQRGAKLRARCVQTLLEMTKHFGRYSEPWDTYADAPYKLAWALQSQFAPQYFTEQQRAALSSAVNGFMAAHGGAR